MSNRKFEELRLSGKQYREQFPFGPFYPEIFDVVQQHFATLNSGELVRCCNEIFLGSVVRKLDGGTKRFNPHTFPRLPWFAALSFHSRSYHCSVLYPNFTDSNRTDGTFSSQHIVMFANTDKLEEIQVAGAAFVDAYERAYNFPS